MNQSNLIQQIKSGDESAFFALYQNYRNIFIRKAILHYNCTTEEVKDVFQDTMCTFHHNIMSGRLQELTVKAESYLWQVGKNHLINKLKRQKMGQQIYVSLKQKVFEDNPSIESEKQYSLLQQLITRLPNKDQQLLNLRYYQNYCMESIARELKYKNAQVVRNRKGKILRKLADDFKRITRRKSDMNSKSLLSSAT